METFRMTMHYQAHDFYLKKDVDAEIDELKRCLKHLLYGDPSGRGTQATITEWAKELLQDKGEG